MVTKKDEKHTKVESTSGSDTEGLTKPKLKVGIIMPIAEIDGCTENHWKNVKSIIQESVFAIDGYEVRAEMVSDSEEVSIIHKNIVNNIYDSDIVIVDVSCKNANVMFELGMRLAFDKIFVLIKDDKTSFIFDTGNIQHLEYPRDLRYNEIGLFKNDLQNKVLSTYNAHKKNPDKSPFLEDYGSLKPAEITEKTVSHTEYLESMFGDLRNDIRRLEHKMPRGNKINLTSFKLGEIELDSTKELSNFVYPIAIDYMNLINVNLNEIDSEELLSHVIGRMAESNHSCSEFLLRSVLNKIVNNWDGLAF